MPADGGPVAGCGNRPLPLLSSNAVMSGRALPTFPELIGPREREPCRSRRWLWGYAARDRSDRDGKRARPRVRPALARFPFAGLAMAAVPFWTLTLLNRRKSGHCALAEAVFAGLFAAAAIYVAFNEGFTTGSPCGLRPRIFLLGATLWRARSVAVVEPIDQAERVFAGPRCSKE